MPTPHDEELGESATLAAIRSSVQRLDADPGAAPTTKFRNRGRSALLTSMSAAAGSGRSFHPRRLAIVGVTILLFGLIAMPALAGPGAIANGVSGAANAVGQMFGNGRSNHDAQDSDGVNATPDHPDNHGADVSAAAHATPEDGETHGEQVRAVARDNHGHEVNDSSKDTSGSNDEQDSSKNGTESGSEENHGDKVRAVAQDNHGADVSAAAHDTPADGTKHGEQVSDVARDNHGADVSAAAHSAATDDGTDNEPVSTTARDNHGADVSAAAQSTATSGEDHGKPSSAGTNDNQGNR
jgi:hypothetical protein